mmetsp:Transcript_167029/g.536322  ORF Transcript_167029/g.536322 Transcript_167029/m.536322 type:complete len:294 (-) Transcript_167029:204-1085(-)
MSGTSRRTRGRVAAPGRRIVQALGRRAQVVGLSEPRRGPTSLGAWLRRRPQTAAQSTPGRGPTRGRRLQRRAAAPAVRVGCGSERQAAPQLPSHRRAGLHPPCRRRRRRRPRRRGRPLCRRRWASPQCRRRSRRHHRSRHLGRRRYQGRPWLATEWLRRLHKARPPAPMAAAMLQGLATPPLPRPRRRFFCGPLARRTGIESDGRPWRALQVSGVGRLTAHRVVATGMARSRSRVCDGSTPMWTRRSHREKSLVPMLMGTKPKWWTDRRGGGRPRWWASFCCSRGFSPRWRGP